MKRWLLFVFVVFILCGCDNTIKSEPIVEHPLIKEPIIEYSCQIGDILVNDMCVHETKTVPSLQWECQNGYTLYGTQCKKTGGVINIAKCGANKVEFGGYCYINMSATPKYVCYSGTLSGGMCVNKIMYNPIKNLVCEENFVLNTSGKCEKIK